MEKLIIMSVAAFALTTSSAIMAQSNYTASTHVTPVSPPKSCYTLLKQQGLIDDSSKELGLSSNITNYSGEQIIIRCSTLPQPGSPVAGKFGKFATDEILSLGTDWAQPVREPGKVSWQCTSRDNASKVCMFASDATLYMGS